MDNLAKHIEQFQNPKPGTCFKSDKLIGRDDRSLAEREMYGKGDSAVATAHTYGRVNEQSKGL